MNLFVHRMPWSDVSASVVLEDCPGHYGNHPPYVLAGMP